MSAAITHTPTTSAPIHYFYVMPKPCLRHNIAQTVLYTPGRAPLNRRFNPALSERVMIGTIARMGHNILLAALALITVAICLQFR